MDFRKLLWKVERVTSALGRSMWDSSKTGVSPSGISKIATSYLPTMTLYFVVLLAVGQEAFPNLMESALSLTCLCIYTYIHTHIFRHIYFRIEGQVICVSFITYINFFKKFLSFSHLNKLIPWSSTLNSKLPSYHILSRQPGSAMSGECTFF